MPDIFDEIAPDSAAGGDIFDQVATPGDIDPFSPDQNNLRRVMQNFPNERAQRVWDQPTVSPEELIKRQTWKDLSAADKLAVDAIRLERGFKTTAAALPKGFAVHSAGQNPYNPPDVMGLGAPVTAQNEALSQEWEDKQSAMTGEQKQAELEASAMWQLGKSIEKTIPDSPQPSNVNRPFGAAAEGVGSLGASMSMAPLGGAPMMSGMFLMELSDAYESEIARQKDTGEPLNPGKASAKASLYAAGAIPLEYIGGAGRLARRWFGTAAENEVRELARKGGGEAVLAFFSERAKDAAMEGGTESLQRLWQDAIVHGKPNIAAALQEGASAAGGSLLLGGVAQGTRLAGHKAGQAFSEARSNENIDRVLQESGQQIALEQSFPPGFAPPIDPAETSGNVFDIFDEVASESQSPQETAQASSGLVTKVTPAAAAATPAPAGASANVGGQTMVHAEPPLNRQQSQVRTELEALPGGMEDLARTGGQPYTTEQALADLPGVVADLKAALVANQGNALLKPSVQPDDTGKPAQTITGSNVQTGTEMPVQAKPGAAILPVKSSHEEKLAYKREVDDKHGKLVIQERDDIAFFGKDSPEARESTAKLRQFEFDNASWVGSARSATAAKGDTSNLPDVPQPLPTETGTSRNPLGASPGAAIPSKPTFTVGQKVAVRLSSRSNKEHLARITQLQPDGSAQVQVEGEKTFRMVAANQLMLTKTDRARRAKQEELATVPAEQQEQVKADAAEFDRLVEDYAPQMEWAPGEAYDRNTAMQEQGVENARLRAAAAQAAMRAVLPGGQSTSLEDKAAAMPKLTAYLKAQFPGDNSIDQRRVLEQFGRTDETQTPAPAEQSARAGEDAQALRRITAQNPDVPELRNLVVHPAAGRVAPAGPPGQLGGNTGRPRRISAPEQKALRELERLFGVRIIVVDSPGARPFNGYKDRKSNVILIHAGTEKLLLSVAGHELLHHLRLTHPALYDELKAALWPLMQNTAQFRVRLERRGQAKADMAEELIADFVGDNLARPGFWATLKQREPDLFTRVARIVRAWLDKLLARLKSVPGFSSDPYFTDLEQARHVVASALVDAARETQFAARGVPGREAITAGNATITAPGLVDMGGEGQFSKVAHHGTPHKVDKFSTAKIGTGEGAQVYGWGLYFAENEAVADEYGKRLGREIVINGRRIDPKDITYESQAEKRGVRELVATGGDFQKAVNQLKALGKPHHLEAVEWLEKNRAATKITFTGNKYTVALNVEDEDLLDWDKPLSDQPALAKRSNEILVGHSKTLSNLTKRESFLSKGYGGMDVPSQRMMLNAVRGVLQNSKVFDSIVRFVPVDVVNILVGKERSPDALFDNPAMLLDLFSRDRSDSVALRVERASSAISRIARVAAENLLRGEAVGRGFDENLSTLIANKVHISGQDLYHELSSKLGSSKDASDYLKSQGISGIRYLDQGSRPSPNVDYTTRRIAIAESEMERWNDPDASRFHTAETIRNMRQNIQDELNTLRKVLFEARNAPPPTYNYVIFSGDDITITHENGQAITAGEALFSKPEGDLFGRPRMSPAEIAADAYKNFPFKGTDVLDADFILPDGKMLLVDDPKFAGAYHQVVADKYGYSGDYRTGAAQFSSDLSAIRFHYSTWRAEPVLSFSWSGGLTSFQRAAIAKIMSAAKEKSERFEVRIEHEVFEGRKLGRGQERILDTPAQSSVFAFMEAQPKTAKEIFAYKDYNPYAAVGPFDPYGPDTDPPQQASAPYGDDLFSKPEGDLFGAPESVAEQRERIKNEELKIKKARAREQMSGRAGARLTAEDLDTTTEMFGAEVRQDKAGQGSLFSKPERPAGASLRITPANLRGELSPMQRTLFAEPASVSVLNEWRKQAFQEIQAAGFVPREVGSLVSWVGQDGKILVQLQKQTHPDAINPRAHGQSMREADAAQIAEAVAMVRQRQSKRGNKIVHSQTAASGSRYLSALIDGRPWMVRLATHSERTSDSSIMLGDKIRQKHLERLAPGEVANHLEIITNDPGAVTWKEVQEKAREQRLDENENTSESGASRTIAGDSLKSASPNQIQTESRMVTGDENQPQTPSSDKSGSLRMGQDVSEGGLFSKPDPSPEFAQLQTRIAGAEAELMAAIRQHIKPPEGMTKAKALAAKNAAVSKLNRLLAEQLKQMTSATVDAARSPEQTAELIAQTVSLLNHAQDEIATHTARSEAIPAGLTQLRQDLQTRLNVLKGWTEDQTDLAANGQPATRSAPKGRDLRKRNLESATDGGRKGIGDFWNSLKAGLRYLTSPIPELPLTGERAEKSALFRRGYRLFAVENNAARAAAAEKINRVLEPLTKLGRKGADNAVLREYYHLGTARQRAAMNPAQLAKIDARMAALEAELNKDPFDLFRRLVLYRDLFWRGSFLKNEQGKPITLPEGLTVEDVQVELARLTKLISEHKDGLAITEALRRHYALTDELQKSILAHGEIIPESLRNPLYFPHHVIDHWTGNFARVRATTEEDFRKYLIAPTGSGALIQTDYLKAMMLHTADVLAHNARIDLVQKYWQPYDISEQLKDEHGANWNKPWNIPPGYKVFTPYKKLPLRMDYILSREVMAEKLGVLFNDGDLRERLGESGLVLKVKPEDLHAALVAGEKIQWALPSEITDALNGIARREAAAANPGLGHALGKPFRALNNFWKKTTLFAPWNWIRYEYGNLSTDAIDKVLAADPGVAKHMARAARELWQSDKGPQSPEFKAAAREGVFETITAGEAGELGRLPQFKPFLTPGEARWDNVRTVLATPMRGSKFREGVFRYAKFLADVERLRAGKEPVYAGAFHGDIEALGEDVDGQRRLLDGDELIFAKAAEISLKTYGDYQSLSVVGQWLREYAVPFWSWQDVNFRYHANQLRNIADGIKGVPGGTERTAALRYAGIRVVSTLLAVGIAKELWNQFGGVAMGLWDEDDDLESKLSEADRRRGHLLLGKDDKGQVKVVYTPSAWSDVAEWMGGQNMKRLFMEYVRGQITLNQFVRDYAKQLPMDVGNKAAQSAGPLLKAPYELASGQATFPDVFDQRQIPKADKWWRFVGGLTDQRVVATLRAAFDQDYYSQPAREQLQQIILQIRRRDPEQWAYYEAREDASDWKEAKTGKRFEHGSYNAPEALALRNFRKSIYRGDVANAERFYNRLIQFGYTAERLDASIRNQHPLSNLNAAARAEYTRTLTPRQQLELELANKYYSRIKALDQRERLLFKSKQVPNRAPNPELLRRIVEDQSRNK